MLINVSRVGGLVLYLVLLSCLIQTMPEKHVVSIHLLQYYKFKRQTLNGHLIWETFRSFHRNILSLGFLLQFLVYRDFGFTSLSAIDQDHQVL